MKTECKNVRVVGELVPFGEEEVTWGEVVGEGEFREEGTGVPTSGDVGDGVAGFVA